MQFRNLLLQALLEGGASELPSLLREVHLQKGQVVMSEDAVPEILYFPGTAVLSAVKIMSDGRAVEVATQGYEGASGLLACLSNSTPTLRTFAQIPGSAIAVSALAFRDLAYRESTMMPTLLRSLAISTDQAEQSVACLALHDVPARAARWILQTQERTSSSEFPLTQENLAVMIGVQRTTVNAAAMLLKSQGMIGYSRGSIRVVDREALKRQACECYHSVEDRWRGDPLSLIQT
ncbi:Crp/Fnr family transcriptional regulator [soil metagenome]